MISALLRNREISDFLLRYRSEDWRTCVEAALVLGIRSLGAREVQAAELAELLSGKPQQPRHRGKAASMGSLQGLGITGKLQRSIGRAWGKTTVREKRSNEKTTGTKTVPRYLQGVESKIKRDVRKDIRQFWSKAETQMSESPHFPPSLPEVPVRSGLLQLYSAEIDRVPILEEDSERLATEEPQRFSDVEDAGDLVHIAEEFLSDPLMAQLTQREVREESRDTPIDFSPPQNQLWDDPTLSPLRQSLSDGLLFSIGESYSMTPSSSLSHPATKKVLQDVF